jgi:hypothetical protein
MSSVFLSHSSQDKVFANKLAKDLRKKGHIVWIDEAEIKIGESLIDKIRHGIDSVDYVGAIISKASLGSEWVKKELDLASNKEIETKQVVILPILLEAGVSLPGFLKGKKYADFTDSAKYSKTLHALLDALGCINSAKLSVSSDDIAELKRQLAMLKAERDFHKRDSERKSLIVAKDRTPERQREIEIENKQFPEYAAINNARTFEATALPITLQYALHAIRKAKTKGSHVLEAVLDVDDK